MSRREYATDLTDAEWEQLEPLILAAKPGGRPRKYDMREILNVIFYLVRAGRAWRLLPLLLAVRVGSYFPGLYTSFAYWVLGPILLIRLWKR